MKTMRDYILSNLMFITRIPVMLPFEYRSDKGNVKYFPLIGVILGFILWFVGIITYQWFGSFPASAIQVFLMIVLTGGIHLDGLADAADGIFSYRSKSQIIEIMKDSRIGAMGVIALIMILLLKFSFLTLFLDKKQLFILLIFPIFGRLSIVNACFIGKPIEKSKLGAGYIGNMTRSEFLGIYVFYTLVLLFIGAVFASEIVPIKEFGLGIAATLVSLYAVTALIVHKVTKVIDGISGDILGAVCEIGEVISLPIFYLGVELCKKYF